jgi:hypothetical protein
MPTLEQLGMATAWGPGDGFQPGELLLPDPDPRRQRQVIISVDDHLVEPGDLFSSRVPARLQDRCPRVIEEEDGREYWLIEGGLEANVALRDRIGVDHIMVEADYPHVDSTWPDTQEAIHRALAGVDRADSRKITHENAARLYRHPLPS